MPRESATTRMLLSALAERLIYGDGDTFSRQDALDLAELLPSPGWRARLAEWLPDVGVRGSWPGAAAVGFAAGVGNTSMPGEKITFDLDSRGRRVVRAGQWKLHRTSKGIEIEQVMADDADEGRSARVEFDRGEPVRMTLQTAVELEIKKLGGCRKPAKAEGHTLLKFCKSRGRQTKSDRCGKVGHLTHLKSL